MKKIIFFLLLIYFISNPTQIHARKIRSTPTPKHKITPTITPTTSPTPTLSPTPIKKTCDTNTDGIINTLDLSYVLSRWQTSDPIADFTKDGKVNTFDLSMLLSNYGK